MSSLKWPRSRKINRCVYCFREGLGLGREHVVPRGLNGEWTLLKASCDRCGGVTHKFEGDALHCTLLAPRVVLRMRTYEPPKKRPKTLPLIIERAGQRSTVDIDPTDYPLYIFLPRYLPPGQLAGRPASPGIPYLSTPAKHIGGPTFPQIKQRFGCDYVGTRVEMSPVAFARMLAKIGYCAAVLAYGLEGMADAPVIRAIMGEDPCVGHWVGSAEGAPSNPSSGLHAFQTRVRDGEIHVVLRLFAQFGAPEYHIVVGKASHKLLASEI